MLLLLAARHHIEFRYDLEGLLNIQCEGLQARIDDRVLLVEALLLRNGLQVFNALADEGGDVANLGEDLRIIVPLYELQELLVDNLDVGDFFGILVENLGSCQKLVFLAHIFASEFSLELVSLLLQTPDKVSKALVNVAQLRLL